MKEKYYKLDKILSKNADYNIIIGERSNGKSYSILDYILKDYLKTGKKGVYLRRLKEDITNKRLSTIYNPFNINKITNGKYNNIFVISNRFYLGNFDEKGNKQIDKECFCYALCLSDMEHDKSTSYPDVNTIFFDEFLSRSFYLRDEFILFMNVISTIVRDRENIKIFMCGNTVNNYSPYFEEMGLKNIKNQKQGTIDLYSYNDNLLLAIEYCGTIQTDKKSNKYFAFNNPKLEMIKGGKWEIGNYKRLPYNYNIKPNSIIFVFYIGFNDDVIQLNVISDKNDMFIFCHKKTTEIKENELYFNIKNNDISPYRLNNIFKCNIPFFEKILKLVFMGKVYYSSNEVGEIFHNYINFIKG